MYSVPAIVLLMPPQYAVHAAGELLSRLVNTAPENTRLAESCAQGMATDHPAGSSAALGATDW
jgi:hypothetical protein